MKMSQQGHLIILSFLNIFLGSFAYIVYTNRIMPAEYHKRISQNRLTEIFVQFYQLLVNERLYRDPNINAQVIAERLGTNARYISAAIATATGGNYYKLVNKIRVKDACTYLRASRHKHLSSEQIGLKVGFNSRQAFYNAFKKEMGLTPREYRLGGEDASQDDANIL